MASDMSIDFGQLQELVNEVRKTKKSRTVHLADGVIAEVKLERKAAARKAVRATPALILPSSFTLESARGSVPTPPHLKGRDIDEIIREAQEEHAERIVRE